LSLKRLDSWKSIALWLHVSVRTAKKLALMSVPEEERLPIFRLSRGPNSMVCAFAHELDSWIERMRERTGNVVQRQPNNFGNSK